MVREFGSLDVRPYQLVHIVSRIGEGRIEDLGDPHLNAIWRAVRENPARPLTLRCNVSSTYAYQNPGPGEDTPEGDLFNVRRDLRILQRMGLVPGSTRPAIDLLALLLRKVETDKDVCWFEEVTSETWKGEPRDSCHYEAGRALGLGAIVAPRATAEMAGAKRESAKAMYEAGVLQIRPHHAMCMTCFLGGREELAPIEEDNLFEAIDIIQKDPEIPIRLICGPCMICPPCPSLDPGSGLCIGGCGMSLRDELKDLDVLQRLGLRYGDVLPAREYFARLYERIPSSRDICGHGDGVERSPEWRVCGGPDGDPRYVKGRAAGLGFLDPTPWAD
jgi:hypothetical protein